jgi:hypothetical protein
MQNLKDMYQTMSPMFFARLVLMEIAGLSMLGTLLTWMIKYRSGFGDWSPTGTLTNYHGLFMVTGVIYIYGHGENRTKKSKA